MLKTILNINEIQLINKKQQQLIHGGYQFSCNIEENQRYCMMIDLPPCEGVTNYHPCCFAHILPNHCA